MNLTIQDLPSPPGYTNDANLELFPENITTINVTNTLPESSKSTPTILKKSGLNARPEKGQQVKKQVNFDASLPEPSNLNHSKQQQQPPTQQQPPKQQQQPP